ncbi:neuronal acetylcholine receptor subunit alpha-3-like isoform X3 [Amphiura filiformis]|uniref:neuronal acetylcholine receptor subunit alpha-3-like isoform X3 n=1 Tax=Amphiura filiformis TaxID=82378 RepID=UPI003B220483
MMLLPLISTFVIINSFYGLDAISAETSEERLFQALFNKTYDKRQRPVNTSHPTPVEVTFYLSVQALQNVNERLQMITIIAWVGMEWTDYRLTWDPILFGGTTRISLPTNDLWTPRIVLENSANRKVAIPLLDEFSRVLVGYDGVILYDSAETISSLCSVDVANFPFDRQNCSLHFTNLADSIELVTLKPVPKLHGYQYDKTQWKLVNLTGISSIVKDPFYLSGDLFFSYIHFEIILRRLPVYHLTNSALPSTILTLLAFTVFLMPPECSEKISLGVSILLGLTVFQLVVSNTLPETGFGGQPILGIYLTMNFTVVAITLFCTTLSMSVYSQPGPVKNRLMRKLFLKLLPAVLLVRQPRADGIEREMKSSLVIAETEIGAEEGDQDNISRENQEAIKSLPSDQINIHNDYKLWRQERWVITVVLDRIFFIMTSTVYTLTIIVLVSRIF